MSPDANPIAPPPSVLDSPLAVWRPVAKISTSRPATSRAPEAIAVVTLLVRLMLAVESPTSMNPPPELAETAERFTIELALTSMSWARSVPPEIVVETLTTAVALENELRTAIAPTPKPDEEAVETSSVLLPMSDFGPPTPTIRPPPSPVRSMTRRWVVPPTEALVKPMTRWSVCVPPIEMMPLPGKPPNGGTLTVLLRFTVTPLPSVDLRVRSVKLSLSIFWTQ